MILNALCISIFAIEHPLQAVRTNFTASSNLEYCTLKSSFGMPSFIARPRGLDRSKISLHVPSGFLTAPNGEQCVMENGGSKKGPDVCPMRNSFCTAVSTPRGWSLADLRFLGLVE